MYVQANQIHFVNLTIQFANTSTKATATASAAAEVNPNVETQAGQADQKFLPTSQFLPPLHTSAT